MKLRPVVIKGAAYRAVEDQEEVATLALVDSIDEEMLLESILEQSKPFLGTRKKFDHLINTPFRYPPLKHGSRFSTRYETSLFYGSLSVRTALAETAYYRFLFLTGMRSPPSTAYRTSHTLFQINYQTKNGLQLQSPTFAKHHDKITHPTHYYFTHELGSQMREQGIEGFEFTSARDIKKGINVAFFSVASIRSKHALHKETFNCLTQGNTVTFKQSGSFISFSFSFTDFFHNGKFACINGLA